MTGEGTLDIIAPANEDGTTARILRWCKAPGEAIRKDEPLLELETDKVTVEVPSPASGELAEILRGPEEEVTPGQLLGRLRCARATGGAAGAGGGAHAGADESATAPAAALAPVAAGTRPSAAPEVAAGGVGPSEAPAAAGLLSPAVRRLLREHALEARDIPGSGEQGRLTVQDVERFIAAHAPMPPAAPSSAATRVPHTPIRRRVAAHTVRSLAESPHVTTLFEVDLGRVQAHRNRHLAALEARGVRLTLTAYFVLACARALKAHPAVNATYHEDALELHADANIGVGTALGNEGLIVPVIRRAQTLDLETTARRLGELVEAARSGELKPEDVRGGTFTISNHGVSGSLLAAPIIIHQPQVAILGVGKVERRVRVLESEEGGEAIAVRPMCYLTLSLDHRALDAYQANAFMRDLVHTLEHWS